MKQINTSERKLTRKDANNACLLICLTSQTHGRCALLQWLSVLLSQACFWTHLCMCPIHTDQNNSIQLWLHIGDPGSSINANSHHWGILWLAEPGSHQFWPQARVLSMPYYLGDTLKIHKINVLFLTSFLALSLTFSKAGHWPQDKKQCT